MQRPWVRIHLKTRNFFIGLICNYIFVEKKIGWMFVQIDYPSFTLLFVKLTEENDFGIVQVIYL